MEPTGTHDSAEQQDQPAEAPAIEYIKAGRTHLRNGRHKEAYGILLRADAIYPSHPIILSYLGWLQVAVDKKYKSGLATCRKAFVQFTTSDPQSAARVYPILYLNLGKTFLANGRKKEAVESFRKGLQYDRSNADLKREVKLLGIRKKPPIPLFSRSNLLNRIVGQLLNAKS